MSNQKVLGKIRNPWISILLLIVTLGIYGIYYGYCVFEEIHRYRGQGWSGISYLVFSFIPILNIVGMAVPWLLPAYVGRMYEEDGQNKPITGLSGFWILLPLIGSIIWFVKIQNRLNEFWLSKGAKQ